MISNKITQGKLTKDIIWSIGSFAILALSGIIINLVITSSRDAASLGIFNLTYAVYIVASQIAVMGINFSVLRHTAYYEDDVTERGKLLFTGILLALSFGSILAIVLFYSAPFLNQIFKNVSTDKTIQYAAFGLILFPINKVLFSYLNGMRHMRAFSILQATRYIAIMTWVSFISISKYEFSFSTYSFLIAEAITFLGAMVYIVNSNAAVKMRFAATWIYKHASFGYRSMLVGMFIEMNSRVDVLLLGVFLDAHSIGIYSFAAMLVDGLYHTLVMVRVNFNPLLVATVRDKNWKEGKKLLNLTKRYGFLLTTILALIVISIFVFLSTYIVPEKGLQAGFSSISILLLGLVLISAFIPFDNILMVTGHPVYQTIQNMTIITFNVIINILTVPLLGISGAAIATATSSILGMVVLIIFCKKIIGWNLLTNSTPEALAVN